MGITPDRLPQSVEELRGDFQENGRGFPTLGQAAGGAAINQPFYLDGRLAYAPAATTSKGDTGAVLRRLQWVPGAAIVGAVTNNFTLGVNRYNAGVLQGAAGALASLTFAAGQNATAFVPIDLTATGTLAGFYLQPGDVLSYTLTQNGTGLAVPLGYLVLEFARLGV